VKIKTKGEKTRSRSNITRQLVLKQEVYAVKKKNSIGEKQEGGMAKTRFSPYGGLVGGK